MTQRYTVQASEPRGYRNRIYFDILDERGTRVVTCHSRPHAERTAAMLDTEIR